MSKNAEEYVWKEILLKNIKGQYFSNTLTLPHSVDISEMSFQIFEVLVSETLARVNPDIQWETTVGSKDDGVDIIGKQKPDYITPFVKESPEQIILGQIKHRKKGYRFDDFKTDINKLSEYYTSNLIGQEQTLMQLIFVISTSNHNNVNNLQKNLKKEYKDKKHISFLANLKSPISIIDAIDIIKYWKMNFDFIEEILYQALSEEELEIFFDYLQQIEYPNLAISLSGDSEGLIGNMIEKKVILSTDVENIAIDLELQWHPGDSSIQLISPLNLVKSQRQKFALHMENKQEFTVLFRGLKEGKFNLGHLEVLIKNSVYSKKIDLGDICLKKNLFPIYQEKPNCTITKEIERNIHDSIKDFYSAVIVGQGGIGKSSLLSEVIIKAINHGYSFIDIQHPHKLNDNSELITHILLEIFSNIYDEVIHQTRILEYIQRYLKSGFNKLWENDLKEYFSESHHYNNNSIVECIVTVIIKFSRKNPCILWLSDMHWLSNENAIILRRIINTLENNKSFLNHKVIFFLEGRIEEVIITEGKHYILNIWKKLIKDLELPVFRLKIWERNDSKDFINGLLYKAKDNLIPKVYEKLVDTILEYSNGIPMHILEQIKYLLNCEKLILKEDGKLLIFDTNWDNLFSDDIKLIIHNRIQFHWDEYPDLIDLLIIYAKLELDSIPACSQYVFKLITIKYRYTKILLEELDFITLNDRIISFRHEYYSECLRELEVRNKTCIDDVYAWFLNNKELNQNEKLSTILLKNMYLLVDYEDLCQRCISMMDETLQENINQELYKILLKIPEKILNKYDLYEYKIQYMLCESIILTGDWTYAKEKFLELVETEFSISDYHKIYFILLSYQEISNISSGEQLLDAAIDYANKGIELANTVLNNDLDSENKENIIRAKEMLIERNAINYLYSGDLEKAISLQKEALESALIRNDTYVILRIKYEMGGVELYTDLNNGIDILENCYNESQSLSMMFKEESYLIKTIQLVGKVKKNYLSGDERSYGELYNEIKAFSQIIKKGSHNFTNSINFTAYAASALLYNNDISEALDLLLKSLECSLDAKLNELLWKCYVNISQIYLYNNQISEAKMYAEKGMRIINKLFINNPCNLKTLKKYFYAPVQKLESILNNELGIYDKTEKYPNSTSVLSVQWNAIQIYLMN